MRSGERSWGRTLAWAGGAVALGTSVGALLPVALLGPAAVAAATASALWAAGAVGRRVAERRGGRGGSSSRRELLWLRALNDLIRHAGCPVDRPSLLEGALAHAARLAHAAAGCVRLYEADGTLTIAAQFGASPDYLKECGSLRFRPGAPERRLLARTEPAFLPAAHFGAEWIALRPELVVRSVLLVPILCGTRIRGHLWLLSARHRPPARGDLAALGVIGTLVGTALESEEAYLALSRQAHTDPLTGLSSRRHFEELYRREVARARRHGRPLSVAMIDIDGMKEINDAFGHVVGDRVLEAVGQILRDVRAGDVAARYGGDEFVLLMPETTAEQAAVVIERLRERLRRANEERLFPFLLQFSVGLRELEAPLRPLRDEASPAAARAAARRSGMDREEEGEEETEVAGLDLDLLRAADAAMYREKERARRRGRSGGRAAAPRGGASSGAGAPPAGASSLLERRTGTGG